MINEAFDLYGDISLPQARGVCVVSTRILIALASLVEDSKPTYAFNKEGGPYERRESAGRGRRVPAGSLVSRDGATPNS